MIKYYVPMTAYFAVTVYADDEREAAKKAERELNRTLGNVPALNFGDDTQYQYCECPEGGEIEAVVDKDEEEEDYW